MLPRSPDVELILVDWNMPVMNGLEFLAAKKQEDALAAIPVCIVSGVADRPEMSGAVGFVKKPIEFDGLLRFVRRYCGAPLTAREGAGL